MIITLIQMAITFGTVIMFGCIGETLTEKAGNLNLGVPGIMYLGGIASLTGVYFYETGALERGVEPNGFLCLVIALVCGFGAAALGGLIYGFLTITLRANQNVTGLTLTIFGSGVANFFGGSLQKLAGGVGQISVPHTSAVFRARIPGLSTLGKVGEIFFSYGFMVYLAVLLAVGIHLFMTKSRAGLNLRAIGENPATADAAGVNVNRSKYLAICLGAGISGMGGVYYVMDYIKGTWGNDGSMESLGWIAVALVIFTTWKTVNAIWGAYLFGILYWMFLALSNHLTRGAIELFKMLPYLVTLLVLILISFRKKREEQPPESLGKSYFREER